jgi:2-dehydropantoate 2-reductase
MRQVPQYLLIGSGRMSKHMNFYLSNKIKYKIQKAINTDIKSNIFNWSRDKDRDGSKKNNTEDLLKKINLSTHILILISDDQIIDFLNKHKNHLKDKICIHFSGCIYTKLAFGAHPLNTFSDNLYDINKYEKIPFILDANSPEFSDLFPMLNNPNFKLDPDKKSLYHAYCVMANNFTTLLWENSFKKFSEKLGIPKQALLNILEQTCDNLLDANKLNNSNTNSNANSNYNSVLTGPLARGDHKTINKNIQALEDSQDPYADIYKAFKNLI